MDRFVMRHPDTAGVALIPESSMGVHHARGWLRVSDAIAEQAMDQVRLADYVDAPDLDAVPEPAGEPAPDTGPVPPAETVKEK